MKQDFRSISRRSLSGDAALPTWKRAVDIVCCGAALPLLGLVTMVFAIVASTVAKGPIFFRQAAVGYRGERFWLYRFRTMRVRSRATTTSNDANRPLLIPGGKFLRASGLVDLPQILNVLRGEMSMVGPQPRREDEADDTVGEAVTSAPGLTGYWRVASRDAHETSEAARRDLIYAARRSLWQDSKIILLTVPTCIAHGLSEVVHASRTTAANPASIRTPSRQPW